MDNRKCLVCGKEYKPLIFRQKYCSPECNHVVRLERDKKRIRVYDPHRTTPIGRFRKDLVDKQQVKCPRCGKLYYIKVVEQSNIMPRLYCQNCLLVIKNCTEYTAGYSVNIWRGHEETC